MTEIAIAAAAPTARPCVENFSAVCVQGVWGAVVILGILFVLHTALFVATWKTARGRRPVVFLDIIVTGDDNCYSLSRLQVYLWTIVIAVGFSAMTFATGTFATIPSNLWLLMGVNLGAAVAATAITANKASSAQAASATTIVSPLPAPPPPVPAQRPSFLRDIFYESGIAPSLDLPRTQMFLWTVITLVTYVVLFVTKFPALDVSNATALLDVPTGMLALMGISQGAYLGAKAAR